MSTLTTSLYFLLCNIMFKLYSSDHMQRLHQLILRRTRHLHVALNRAGGGGVASEPCMAAGRPTAVVVVAVNKAQLIRSAGPLSGMLSVHRLSQSATPTAVARGHSVCRGGPPSSTCARLRKILANIFIFLL